MNRHDIDKMNAESNEIEEWLESNDIEVDLEYTDLRYDFSCDLVDDEEDWLGTDDSQELDFGDE